MLILLRILRLMFWNVGLIAKIYKGLILVVFMKGKKGAEMTIGTIVVIVLAVAVLVFLIWGFSTGWTNLWGKVNSYFGGAANVDTIRQACVIACNTQQKYDYCEKTQTINFGEEIEGLNMSSLSGSCKEFANSTYGQYTGVADCPGLC